MKRSSTFGLRLFTSAFLILFTFAQPLLAIESLTSVQDAASTESVVTDTQGDILDEGISDPEEIAKPIWFTSGESATTSSPVVVGETYTYPINPAVTVTFSKLPATASSLTIKTIYLTDEQVKATNAASNVAYDITTDMADGTFKYNLTLPKVGDSTKVIYAEDVGGLTDAKDISNVVENGSSLKIDGLNHFTLFVIVDDGDTNFSTTGTGWSSHASGYNGDHKWITNTHNGSHAVWTYADSSTISDGAIFVSWTQWNDHATNAKYTSSVFSDFEVNQKLNSQQSTSDGNGVWSGWYRVPGDFSIHQNTKVDLKVWNDTDGNLSADAVAFVDLNEAPMTVWVDDNYSANNAGYHFWGYDAFNNVQEALAAVANGGIINIANGTYTENGQIVINKKVSVIGENRDNVVIKPNANTGNSGDSRGWILVNAGKEFNIENVTLDGTGKLISIGILSHGTGVIDNNIIRSIGYNPSGPDYAGRAIAFYDTSATITHNLIQNYGRIGIYTYGASTNVLVQNNTLIGKGLGNHLDYAVEIEGGANVRIDNNDISGNKGIASVDGSTSAAILGTTYFTPGAFATITNNNIHDNSYGITLGYASEDSTSAVLDSNLFSNNEIDINNGTINNIDARTTQTWSVTNQNDLDQIEAKIYQNCNESPYTHGTCNTDDYGTGYGFVQYKNIQTPINLGWNVSSKSLTPNEVPLDLACSTGTVYTNENSVAQNWSGVSGLNVKYQREVTYPAGSIGYFEAGSITNTPFATFGSGAGIEGLWKTRVKAYVDVNLNNRLDSGEESSEWSNYCNITLDRTVPAKSTGLSFSDKGSSEVKMCGAKTSSHIGAVIHWDASSDVNFDHYEYRSFNADGSTGPLRTFTTNSFDASWWTVPMEGTYGFQVRAVDKAGNAGEWTDTCNIVEDWTAPDVTTTGIKYPNSTVVNKFVTNYNTPTIVGQVLSSDTVSVELTINSQTYDATINGSNWEANVINIVPDGTYEMQIVATDDVGNSKTTTQTITIDTKAPTAVYTHYDNGVEVLGAQAFVQSVSQLSFTGTYTDFTPSSELYWDSFVIFQAQDNGSFAFSQNGKQAYCSWRQNPNLVELSGNPFTLTTQRQFTDCVATLPEGTYYMTHQVYDNATRKDIPTINQFRDVLGLKFTVDTTAPVSQFTQNQANTYHNTSILLQGVSNDINGVTGVSLYYKNTNSSNWILIETQTNSSNSSTFSWSKTWTPPYQGTFDVKAEATDQAGNTEHSPRMNRIVYDLTSPTVQNVNVTMDYFGIYVNGRTGFLISVPVSDTLSGIKGSTCEYTIDGMIWDSTHYDSGNCYLWIDNSSLFDNQGLDIAVRVKDRAGNQSTTSILERTVDKALPTSQAVIDEIYYGPNSLPTVKGTATDTVSSVTNAAFSLRRGDNGKYWITENTWWNLSQTEVIFWGLHNTVGTDNWTYTGTFPSMKNGVTYTVTPYAWDQVHFGTQAGTVDRFIWDNVLPNDPSIITSTSHTSAPNKNNVIDIQFNEGSDLLSGVAGYYYSFSNTKETPDASPSNWLILGTTNVSSQPLADGTWYFNIRTVDNAGNITSTAHSTPYTIDATAPSVPMIVSPVAGQYFNATPILNDWADSADVSGIASYKVEYKYDDGHTFPDAPYRTTTVSQRNHIPGINEQGGVSFRVKAFDNAGNESDWSSWVHYYYDQTAPTKPVITNTTTFTNINAITVNWTGGDDQGQNPTGIKGYSIRYVFTPANGGADINWTSGLVLGGNPHTRSGSYGHGEGKYVIYVKTIDMAGNESPESDSYTITYDKTAPDVEITAPISTHLTGMVEVRGTVTDVNPHHYWFVIENSSHAQVAGSGTVNDTTSFTDKLLLNWNTDSLSEGQYTIKLEARDAANNKDAGSVQWLVVTIDHTQPTVDLQFDTPSPSATSFKAVFSESMNEADATNPANYFLNNWPTAGGTGDLLGDASISYDSETNTATVTFLNAGWYLSPEQQWGVQNIHDLAGNMMSVTPYTEYTTPMVAPVTTVSGIDSLWHNTDVTVTLTCTDVDGSGCYKTHYSINGDTEQDGNTVVVSAEGLNTITFYSEDMAGNVETVQTSEVVKIDKTNPEAQVLSSISFTTGDTTPRSLALSDNNELAQVCYVIDTNTQTCLPLFGTGYSWDITNLINTLSVGTHIFTYYVVDTAGNRSDSNIIVEGNDPYAASVVVAAIPPQRAVRGAATVAETTPEVIAQTTPEETTTPVTTPNTEEVKGTQDTNTDSTNGKPIPWWVYVIGGAALLSFIIFLIARRRREEEDKEKNIK